jgi:PleD family two-component response regulator
MSQIIESSESESESQDIPEEPRVVKRILIVDDQPFNIDALTIILKYSIGVDS